MFGFRCSRLVASRTHMAPSSEIMQAAQAAGIEACAQLEGAQVETARALQLCDAETLQGELLLAGQCLEYRGLHRCLWQAQPPPHTATIAYALPFKASSPGMERLPSVLQHCYST